VNPDPIRFAYKNVLKPILFSIDAEKVHDSFVVLGETLGRFAPTRQLTDALFNYKNSALGKDFLGIHFPNPVGLAAGFDYDGRLARILPHVGFGFETIGTVTNKPYEGNTPPRLARLPKSQSLLVNKGFKSSGVEAVAARLNGLSEKAPVIGVSVGSSNVAEIDTVNKAIVDYVECFSKLKSIPQIKYFELNISCPNTLIPESFTEITNFSNLIRDVVNLKLNKPIFIKMPNELPLEQADQLVQEAMKNNINAFVFSNLVKDRTNSEFDRKEIQSVANLKGNFSGRPTHKGALTNIEYFKNKYGGSVVIVGCGGIFSPADAQRMLTASADLVQLITGMIFEGPQLISTISRSLV
jgi:dihydroorotate dehydrogenase